MTENSRTMFVTLTGAVLGGAAGYLLFTDRGRALTRQFEPALDDFTRDLNSFRSTLEKAAGVASQGWRLLNEAARPLEEASRPIHSQYPGPHQSSPF